MSQINILTGKDKFETTLSVEGGKYYIDINKKPLQNDTSLEGFEDPSWFNKPVYGVESVEIGSESLDCDVHYSMEKFFGNKKDGEAPAAGKMKIRRLGYGSEVVFSDGSVAKNELRTIFSSPYVKQKIKEFDDYYIGKNGYGQFTPEDQKTFKIDLAQHFRKIFTTSTMGSPLIQGVQIKWFGKTAIYGLFGRLLGKGFNSGLPGQAPFCIVYTKKNEKGEKRVIVRRFLVVGIFSKKITEGHSKAGSGGKEIGTVT
jgi:hypothetical protein